MLKIVESAGVSKETHPDLFRGIEAIAKEFPLEIQRAFRSVASPQTSVEKVS
jgi:hypothetical protein